MTGLCFLLLSLFGFAQDDLGPEQGVGLVEFVNDTSLSEEVLRTQLRTKEGERYDPAVVDADQKAIGERYSVVVHSLADPWLDASGQVREDENGRPLVKVRFVLANRPAVRRVEFRGNRQLIDEELREALGLTARGVIPRGMAGGGLLWLVERLRERYREEGYLYAEVDARLEEEEGEPVLTFEVVEGPQVHVSDIRFLGLSHFSERNLRSLMETSESFLFIRNEFRQKELEQDLSRIEEFLRDEGYLDATAGLERLEPHPDHKDVDIIIRIVQGPRYEVGEIRFEGNDSFSAEELREVIKVQEGKPFRRVTYKRDWQRLTNFYGHRGFIRARQDPRIEPESYRLDEPIVDLTYAVVEDLPKRIRDVLVEGNINTSDDVIRRDLFLYPGQLFDTEEMRYSEDRLRASRLFLGADGNPKVFIDSVETDDPRQEDLVIEVEEGQTGFLNFTAGISSGTGFFVGISADKENFDLTDLPSSLWDAPGEFFGERCFHGGGQLLRLRANPGGRFSNYLINFREPVLTGPHELPLALDTSLFFSENRLRLFDEDRYGGQVIFSQSLSRDSALGLGARIARIEIRRPAEDVPDILAQEGGHTLLGPIARYNFRELDSIRNPTDGYTFGAETQLIGGAFGGDFDLFKASVNGEFFYPLYENEDGQRHVLQVRSVFNYATAYADTDDVPFFERYYAGGLTALRLRGFDFRGVGPHQADEPVGGTAGVVVNTDYVFPIYETYDARLREHIPVLRGIVFFDQGTLVPEFRDLSEETWRMSAGVGLRLRIPVPIFSAPLEVYYGVALNRAKFDEREGFTLSLTTRF